MSGQRLAIPALLGGLICLGLVWHWHPIASPPLYDGITLPAEPYRYLKTPAGLKATKPPTSGFATLGIKAGKSPEVFVTTRENPPQAILILADGALKVPTGVTRVRLSVRPVPPPGNPPGTTVDGNVYEMSATSPSGLQVPLNPSAGAQVQLRKTGLRGNGNPSLDQFVAGQWVRRPSALFVNADYLAANVKSLGYFALVTPGRPAPSTNPWVTVGLIGLALLLLLAGLLLLLRSAGRSTSEPSPGS